MSNPESLINNQDELHTREEILENTGYRLQLYFPQLPENEDHLASYESELKRMSVEFGAENVIGGFVLTDGHFGGSCQAIFVQQDAPRTSSKS